MARLINDLWYKVTHLAGGHPSRERALRLRVDTEPALSQVDGSKLFS